MGEQTKDINSILAKLGISALNPMQEKTLEVIPKNKEVVLLSPTGTGKTLAFLLPILAELDPNLQEVQALILAPSRELAQQIEQVCREMGSGFKTNAVYGGRPIAKDKIDLKHPPTILIGTPGRVADHFRRGTFATFAVKVLVLDEFDKSLEVGFSKEMKEIIRALTSLEKKILTSATQKAEIPDFVGFKKPQYLHFLNQDIPQLALKTVISKDKDKLKSLSLLLQNLPNQSGIVFCNLKDSIQKVSDYLAEYHIPHACFYGGLEQQERERALIKFKNGTHKILIATDLAARGIDVAELDFIVHFEIPYKEEEFTHRNGRTARMKKKGTAYVVRWEKEYLPSFIKEGKTVELKEVEKKSIQEWETLFISGGRKDKISKGDIAGLFIKQGKLKQVEVGVIELKQDCSFVSVPKKKANELINLLNNSRLKKKKVRIQRLD